MIVSASYRTDIPAFYTSWFLKRLAAGSVPVTNPYGGRPTQVPLTGPEVDGYLVWTRNPEPFAPALEALAQLGLPVVIHLTITGYPRALDRSVIAADRAVAAARALARRYGPRAVVWRYDPVVWTDATPPDWHRRQMATLAAALAGTVDEVCLSAATIYRKTRRNLDRAAARHGFAWRDPPPEEKRALLSDLASLALDAGLRPTLCSQPDLLAGPLEAAACVDAKRLSDVAERPIAARRKGNRPGCLCAESRDIGAYDTCPHGCAYCYAVSDRGRAQARQRAHDPAVADLAGAAALAPRQRRPTSLAKNI
ncbi:MAG: DUF1848 family protein [Rhodospirillaceae bacterium]|nr:DUF1848 family protein [Rhodospirillaceae bacterium]